MILAFALAPGSGQSPSSAQATTTVAVSVSAPTPSADAIEPCAQVLSALPVQLDDYLPRRVYPYPDDSAPVVAWGNPAIIFQCGVSRPSDLTDGSTTQVFLVDDVNWLPTGDSKTTVFTAVDRAVYIQLTVPKSYAQPPLAEIADAIASVLPPVCHFPADEVASSSAAPTSPTSRAPGQPVATGSPTATGSATASPTPTGPVGPLCTHRP